MIVDYLSNAFRYQNIHKGFKEAFAFLQSYKDLSREPQRLSLNGTDLIAIIESGCGKGHSGARLEAHRQYIDIQYILEGHEEIGWKPYRDCRSLSEVYNNDKDIEFFSDAPVVWLPFKAGSFAIFFPEDAHAPLAGTTAVHKIIMKVAINVIE